MIKGKVAGTVEKLIEPLLAEMGYELVHCEFVKEGGGWYLRIFIDKPGGIELDDCQRASQAISVKLDEADPISQSYFLEVSSPGIERPLNKERDYLRFKGEQVKVGTFAPVDGQKEFIGLLEGWEEDKLRIIIDAQYLDIPKDKVAWVRLYPFSS